MGNINHNLKTYECCIIGAGPAGLGAALELTKHGITDILIIDKNRSAGGLSRTEVYDGVRFDIGPHRFFTKNKVINKIWHETLGEDFMPVSRLTRIFYKNKYFNYPIKPEDIFKLGALETLQAVMSFCASHLGIKHKAVNFEDWVIQNFGSKLYETFFKTYTEKIWGIPCNQIGVEWAAQRIKGLDALEIIKKVFIGKKNTKIKTLIEEFEYPVLGAGQMYEAICDKLTLQGVAIMMNTRAENFILKDGRIESVDIVDQSGNKTSVAAGQFFSSTSMTQLFHMLNSLDSKPYIAYADMLRYRAHITVNMLADGKYLFPDQWIYVHSPDFKMARLANYNNFSSAMVGNKNKTAISVEYFVFNGETLWNESDEFLGNLAMNELDAMGLIKKGSARRVGVVRESEAYPVYYDGFDEPYQLLKRKIDQFSNLYSIGRAGMYKYNNQDHSMLNGILAARNYLKLPGSPYILWDINTDDEYQEDAKRRSK